MKAYCAKKSPTGLPSCLGSLISKTPTRRNLHPQGGGPHPTMGGAMIQLAGRELESG
jgi:hypothetical protein